VAFPTDVPANLETRAGPDAPEPQGDELAEGRDPKVHNHVARGCLLATLVVLMLTLIGCAGGGAPESLSTSTRTPGPMIESAPDPEINLDGDARGNLAFFDLTNTALIAAGGSLDGRAFVDNLVAVGYPRSDMEVTSDRTAIDLPADNIQFAIRLNGTCLIGQYGNIGYASTTARLLNTGRCLVGNTRPIDW
jgi:hypothetical protein